MIDLATAQLPLKSTGSGQPPSQALVSVFMQVPNWDISLANATESLAQNICKQHSHRDIWSQLRKSEYKVQPPCRTYEVERVGLVTGIYSNIPLLSNIAY